MKYLKIRIR